MRYHSPFIACLILLLTTSTFALPKLEEPVPLPAEFEDVITIYPDNSQPKRYWVLPSVARIVKRQDGKLAFGLVHSGLSSFDPDGISALLTMTVQPYIDQTTLSRAKNLIAAHDRDATFSFINPIESTCRLMVGGQYVDWDGNEKSVISGGLVEAGIPFQFKTLENLDVRALSQAGGGDANTVGAIFTMKYRGVGKRIHFKITAKYEQTLEHYKAAASGSGWFGLVKAKASAEWTSFKDKPYVHVEVFEGTQDDVDKYMDKYGAQKLINTLAEQLANRTGMFARTVHPTNLPDAPGGGGLFGWGLSAGGGFEKSTSTSDLVFEVSINLTEEREITYGMTFPTSSEDLKPYVKNLTDSDKTFPTGEDYKKIREQNGHCMTANLQALKSLLNAGLLPEAVYLDLVKDAVSKGCHVHYEGVDGSRPLADLTSKFGKQLPRKDAYESRIPDDLVMELLLRRKALQAGHEASQRHN